MKRNFVVLLGCSLGMLAMTAAGSPGVVDESEIPAVKLVNAIRVLNTQQYSYRDKTGRFATREELLAFLREKNVLSKAPIDLENPKPYELAIVTSPDQTHYQITLKPTFDPNDKSTWCKTAAFSDEAGVIFLGAALDCKASTR